MEFLAIDLDVVELKAKEVTLLDGVPFEVADELTSIVVAKSNIRLDARFLLILLVND